MTPDIGAPERLDIRSSLRGEHLFITGGTGFLGKVLVEALLWSVPEVGGLTLLVRGSAGRSAEDRLREDVFASPVMARLRAVHGSAWDAWASGKVEAVAGDLGQDRFGLDDETYSALCAKVDRLVACAATTTFDERLDQALSLNARGALRTLALARDAGNVPLLHVSTCFVSGRRKGLIPETLPLLGEEASVDDGAADLTTILGTLDERCELLSAEALSESEPGSDSDSDSDSEWIAAGAELANRYGFHDVYTLTKALGERLIARERGDVPIAIVRPAIVESAAKQPIPGWIDAVRVADPLVVAFGRGRTERIPGTEEARLELIPVDYVVHASLAALADLSALESGDAEPRIYQVGSSRHPVSLGELMASARQAFTEVPLRAENGQSISVPKARFVAPEAFRQQMIAQRETVQELSGSGDSPKGGRRHLGGTQRVLDHFIRLVEVYRPYLEFDAQFDDGATLSLWNRLSPEDQQRFPFDVAGLDWQDYMRRVHVPGLVRFALRAETGAPSPESKQESEVRDLAAAHSRAAEASTLFELFEQTAQAEPEAMAFQTYRDGRWLRYSYRQALTSANNVAWSLSSRYGIERGDRVVLWSSGCPEWVLTTFAVHRLGAVTVPLDPQWPVAEVEEAARLVGAKLVCALPRLVAQLAERSADLPCPMVELAEPFVPDPAVAELPGVASLPAHNDVAGEADLATIVFTSGTTVAPKAVPLTHGNFLANVRDLVPLMHLTRDRLLSVLPIHHVFELMTGLLVPMAGASTISYVAEIKPAEISWMMNTTRPTVLVAVPRLLGLLHGGIEASVAAGGPKLARIFKVLFALSRLSGGRFGHKLFSKVHQRFGGCLRRIVTGGSALEPALGRSFWLMGFKVAEGYGMTETSPVLTVNPWDGIRFGSVGRPLPGVGVDLRPPAEGVLQETRGGEVADGSGEIWVRGANVMSGYFENPQATAEVMADGWLNTGDLGAFDSDGYLVISGRTKDVIVTTAGKNVYPEEVELRYKDLPGVEELVVLGLPVEGHSEAQTGLGERVSAVVVPQPDAEEEAIRSAISARSSDVPSYQQISGIEIWRGELPKTTTMKVKRGRLRDAILAGQRGRPSEPATPPVAAETVERSEEETWIVETLARLTSARPDTLDASDRLNDLGVDSLTRVELVGEIEGRLGLRLDDAKAASLARVQDLFDLADS